MVNKEKALDKLVELEDKRDELEAQIDIAVFGESLKRGAGDRPSMYSYNDAIWEEEILLDPSLKEKLAEARDLQREVRQVDQDIADLREQVAQEEAL